MPDSSGASDTYKSSELTLAPGNVHNHTRTVNGWDPHGPGTNGVAETDTVASRDGFDRDADTVSEGNTEPDAAADATGSVVATTDADAKGDADKEGLDERDTNDESDSKVDGDRVKPAGDTLAIDGVAENDNTGLTDARCVPSME